MDKLPKNLCVYCYLKDPENLHVIFKDGRCKGCLREKEKNEMAKVRSQYIEYDSEFEKQKFEELESKADKLRAERLKLERSLSDHKEEKHKLTLTINDCVKRIQELEGELVNQRELYENIYEEEKQKLMKQVESQRTIYETMILKLETELKEKKSQKAFLEIKKQIKDKEREIKKLEQEEVEKEKLERIDNLVSGKPARGRKKAV